MPGWGLSPAGTRVFLPAGRAGAGGGQGSGGQLCKGPREPATPQAARLLPLCLPGQTGIIPQVVSVIKYRLITLSGY